MTKKVCLWSICTHLRAGGWETHDVWSSLEKPAKMSS